MTTEDHQSYYRRRAIQERQRAATCEDNAVAIIHLDLAEAYEQRVVGNGGLARPWRLTRQ